MDLIYQVFESRISAIEISILLNLRAIYPCLTSYPSLRLTFQLGEEKIGEANSQGRWAAPTGIVELF